MQHPRRWEGIHYHQPPEVNYLPCLENDDLPCRLHEKHVVCRVNHRSRNRSKYFTSGGWWYAISSTHGTPLALAPPLRGLGGGGYSKVNLQGEAVCQGHFSGRIAACHLRFAPAEVCPPSANIRILEISEYRKCQITGNVTILEISQRFA